MTKDLALKIFQQKNLCLFYQYKTKLVRELRCYCGSDFDKLSLFMNPLTNELYDFAMAFVIMDYAIALCKTIKK